MSKQYVTCPYCGANLDPGERCDCQRAAPGGYPYGNQTGAKSAPVQIVHPSMPGLPVIVFCHGKPQSDPAQIDPGSK